MKWTKTSEEILSFFMDNKCIQPIHTHKKQWILHIFSLVKEADKWLQKQKRENPGWIQRSIGSNIPKPATFDRSSFPHKVMEHIDRFSRTTVSYTFSLFHRNIVVHFILEKGEKEIDKYNEYIERIVLWLYIVHAHSSSSCSRELHLFLYQTSLLKELPTSKETILDEHNVNTAFTYTCPRVSEIVVYRKEEWFKVLIHETFHNFALDFSDMREQMEYCNKRILRMFHVESEVNLYETYTESWARIWNAVFCSYFSMNHKKRDELYFLSTFDILMRIEIIFSFFQMVKILYFMGLRYTDIVSKTLSSNAYREKTNVLAYFIISLVILDQYEDFLSWCSTNNGVHNIFAFRKTQKSLQSFCDFIEKKYKDPSLLRGVECMESFLSNMKPREHKNVFLLKNMRMTATEWG